MNFFRKLLEFTFHDDEATSEAAASALKFSMQTTEAKETVERSSDTELKNLLRPFAGPLSLQNFDQNVLTKESNSQEFDLVHFARYDQLFWTRNSASLRPDAFERLGFWAFGLSSSSVEIVTNSSGQYRPTPETG